MVVSAVDDAAIVYRRMTMPATEPVEETVGVSYAATLAVSGNSASVKPAGTANEIFTSDRETFGGGNVGKVQELPSRPSDVPSGHTSASIGHATDRVGYSTAFRYTNPPKPTIMMN